MVGTCNLHVEGERTENATRVCFGPHLFGGLVQRKKPNNIVDQDTAVFEKRYYLEVKKIVPIIYSMTFKLTLQVSVDVAVKYSFHGNGIRTDIGLNCPRRV